MGDLSEHFSVAEFRCKGFGHRGHPSHVTKVDHGLVELLELIRAERNEPLHIVSGHRCSWWNSRVGGARHSRHLVGDAADIPPGWVQPARAHLLGAWGVGQKNGWAVHVDRRGWRADWSYDTDRSPLV
jgi:uncharacterized protein YcbK (DUF882 family)